MRRWPVLGVALAVLWLFVRGPSLTAVRLAEEGLIGLGVGLPIAFVFRRFYRTDIAFVERAVALPSALIYLVLFLWELLTANLDVAYRVLAPSMPIEPDVVEVPLRVETDVAITTIANSITLTPGTLTMEYESRTNTLYVHAIDGRDHDAVREPIRRWEDYALRIFDEDHAPSDPAPSPDERRAAVAADGEPADSTDASDGSEQADASDGGGEADGE
ncbi:MAG: Na+/H+ antiporter subunit E [Haloarculaceae archaeon]